MYKEEKRYLLIDKSFPHTGCPLHTYLARLSLSFLSCSLSAGRMSSCSSAIASADVSSPCWAFREFIVASSLSSFSTKRLESQKKKPDNQSILLYPSFFCLFVGIGTGQRNRLEDGNCYILRTLIGHNKSNDELLTTATPCVNTSSQVRLSSDTNDFESKLHDCSFLEPVFRCTNDCSFLLFLERLLQFSSHVLSIWLFSRF